MERFHEGEVPQVDLSPEISDDIKGVVIKGDQFTPEKGIEIKIADEPVLLGRGKTNAEVTTVDIEGLLNPELIGARSPDVELELGQKLEQLVSAIRKTALLEATIELSKVAEKSQEKISEIGEKTRQGTWRDIGPRELELFARAVVLGVSQIPETESIKHVVEEALEDASFRKTLGQLADRVSELNQVVEQVTDKMASADDPNQNMFRWVVLGCAVLLAVGAGAIVPLMAASATAEVILTNEVAIFAVAIAAATLIKGN